MNQNSAFSSADSTVIRGISACTGLLAPFHGSRNVRSVFQQGHPDPVRNPEAAPSSAAHGREERRPDAVHYLPGPLPVSIFCSDCPQSVPVRDNRSVYAPNSMKSCRKSRVWDVGRNYPAEQTDDVVSCCLPLPGIPPAGLDSAPPEETMPGPVFWAWCPESCLRNSLTPAIGHSAWPLKPRASAPRAVLSVLSAGPETVLSPAPRRFSARFPAECTDAGSVPLRGTGNGTVRSPLGPGAGSRIFSLCACTLLNELQLLLRSRIPVSRRFLLSGTSRCRTPVRCRNWFLF